MTAHRPPQSYGLTKNKLMTPKEQHQHLIAYLKAKVEWGDWHGVSDAANDLRELEARHPTSSHTVFCTCDDCERAQRKEDGDA